MNHLETVKEFFETGRVEVEVARKRIGLSKGVDEISIRKGNDGKWRYCYHSTYGNGSFVNGEGCDASGYVILDADMIEDFDTIIAIEYLSNPV